MRFNKKDLEKAIMGACIKKPEPHHYLQILEPFAVENHLGIHFGEPEDYIVRGKEDIFLYRKEDFEKEFET